MDLFRWMSREGHEQLVVSTEPETGLRAIIAIHSTVLGPALGGCRFWSYPTFESAAVDALRLSKTMTYKAAINGLNLGGGKAVISGRPQDKTPALLRAFGRFVDSLAGLYITAEDVGVTVSDLSRIREVTRYATGLPTQSGGGGDPSLMTAKGVLHGMRACLEAVSRSDSLDGVTVAVQGLGKVGLNLVDLLSREGAQLIVSDIDSKKVGAATEKFGAKSVSAGRIQSVKCDLYAPCALGGVLTPAVISHLRCRIVAGSANNPLSRPSDARRLEKRKILYAPDYVINAGGLINIACEMEGYRPEKAELLTAAIRENLERVFTRAKEERITPLAAADRIVEDRLDKAKADRSAG